MNGSLCGPERGVKRALDTTDIFCAYGTIAAVTYIYIDQCDSPYNQILTLFGYLHVAFQPFFANMVAMYFVHEHIKKKISTTVYNLCGVAAFVMPFIYSSWRFVSFHFLVGPLISDILTNDPNEFSAVWCLFSIALCVSVFKTPIRKHLHVKSWPFYKQSSDQKQERVNTY